VLRTTVFLVIACLALSACGSSSPKPSAPAGTKDAAAARVAQAYVDAYAHRRPARVCALLAAAVRAQLTQKGSCTATVRASLKGAQPRLKVSGALRQGTTATAKLTGSPRQITLTREGATWKVSDGGT
jgi:ABC-type Fe3+-hydroxamate transport system substrate-binding protein